MEHALCSRRWTTFKIKYTLRSSPGGSDDTVNTMGFRLPGDSVVFQLGDWLPLTPNGVLAD
jgi:hypothetical protein